MEEPGQIHSVGVVGTGAWGTVIACLFAGRCAGTVLYARGEDEAALLAKQRENARFLPGVRLPDALAVTADARVALSGADLVVLATPSQRLRENLQRLASALPAGVTLLCASKGIEIGSGLRMSQVIADVLGTGQAVALTLSGPNLSGEIAAGLPAATVVAGPPEHAGRAAAVQALLSNEQLRVYTSDDQPGVELGGALKNVIAIACGVCDGLGYGHNARAGLITRGLAEMTRLAVACGGRPATLAGLAGLGDLLTTVASAASRNYSLGVALGSGTTLAEARAATVHIAEGVPTAHAALDLARRLDVELPITERLCALLDATATPVEGARALMQRALGAE
jgi:glycerol-3-phosphate dehydrogenase (NAD(P)+)